MNAIERVEARSKPNVETKKKKRWKIEKQRKNDEKSKQRQQMKSHKKDEENVKKAEKTYLLV